MGGEQCPCWKLKGGTMLEVKRGRTLLLYTECALVRASVNTAWCEWSRAVGHGAIGFRLYCQRALRYRLTCTLPNVATLSALVEHVHAPSTKSLLTLRSGPLLWVVRSAALLFGYRHTR